MKTPFRLAPHGGALRLFHLDGKLATAEEAEAVFRVALEHRLDVSAGQVAQQREDLARRFRRGGKK